MEMAEVRSFRELIAHPFRELGRDRREEAACLRLRIEEKASSVIRDANWLDCFLTYRFEIPLRRHGWRGPWYGRAFTYLSVAAIAAGVASSAISSQGSDGSLRWVVFSLGLVVAIATAMNQLWKPAQRSVGAYRAGNALRREGWDYVNDRGRYRKVQGDRKSAFDTLIDQIRDIQAQVDSIDEVQAEIPGQAGGVEGDSTSQEPQTPDASPPQDDQGAQDNPPNP